jgi:hypothetical protein
MYLSIVCSLGYAYGSSPKFIMVDDKGEQKQTKASSAELEIEG